MLLKEKKFLRDVIFGTLFIFFIMGVGGPILQSLDFLDPIGEALEDMEITDQVFSNPQLREIPPADTNIVIVNIGYLSRRDIARQINIINHFEPKVIGLDVIFRSLKPDTLGDLMLADALNRANNLVMYTKLLEPDDNGTWHDLELSHPLFTQDNITAHVNLITDQAGIEQHQFKTCRTFFPLEQYKNPETGEIKDIPAFSVQLAMMYDSAKAQQFLERGHEEEVINYRGNIMDFGRTAFGTRFFALDTDQVLDTLFSPDLIKDKIVILGFLGASLDDQSSYEDKYFTPLNVKYAGRANPDMYGPVIHANIISMILNADYIDQMSDHASYIFAVVICFLNVMLFQWIYRRLPRWYDGLTKLIQLVEAILLLFVIVLAFHYFSIKLNLTLGIIAVLLAGDSLEVYNGVIKNLFSKERRRQLFTIRED